MTAFDPQRPSSSDEELLGAEITSVVSEKTDPERIARMSAELEMGFERLRGTAKGVSIFGSARTPRRTRIRAAPWSSGSISD